jgi:hypothetical protein
MNQAVLVSLVSAFGLIVSTAIGLLATRKYGAATLRAERAEGERLALKDRQARLDAINDRLIDTLQEEIVRRDKIIEGLRRPPRGRP